MDTERQHQEQMFEACDTGHVGELRHLRDAAGVEKGDPPVKPTRDSPVLASGPAATLPLLAHAVARSQPDIVALLLETFPTASVSMDEILSAAFVHPHLGTFKLLYERDNTIVDHEFEESTYGEAALMVACQGDEPDIPDFLLEKGADPNSTGLELRGCMVQSLFLERCSIVNEIEELEKYEREEAEKVRDNKELREAFERRIRTIAENIKPTGCQSDSDKLKIQTA
ncbi:MAG: hypothetical protein LQ338_006350 [Usnochroma carphineum]|nr:MAG: hypothetical protein LQ338_006350 [Usnochroma carphineum]